MKLPSLPGRVLGGARYNQHRDQRNDSERETIYESRTRSPNQHAPFHLVSLSVVYWPPDDDEHPPASVTPGGVTYDKDSMAQLPEHRAAGEKQEVVTAATVGRQLRHQQAVVGRAGGQAALRCTSATTSSEGKTSVTRRRTASPL